MLTTLETVKAELGITNTDDDSFLTRKIQSVSSMIERFCGRKFGKETVTEKLNGVRGQELILTRFPVIEVVSVTVDSSAVTDYELSGNTGILYRETGWSPEFVRLGLGEDPIIDAKKNITVVYEAGYVLPVDATVENPRTLPYELEDFCIQAVKTEHYKKNVDPTVESEKLQSYSVTYDRKVSTQRGLPLSVINGLKESGWVSYS